MNKVLLFALLIGVQAFATDATTDNDMDGLPDLWEAAYGLSTNALTGAEGLNGPDGDPDEDGLSNLAEYMAGYTELPGGVIYSNYTWAVVGLNPTNGHSLSADHCDYWLKALPEHLVSLGWMFSDHDFTDGAWELEPTNNASVYVTDDTVLDLNTGWSTYERCRMSLNGMSKPIVDIRAVYRGKAKVALPITLKAYSDCFKDPDATFVVTSINQWHRNVVATSGALRPSSKYWVAHDANVTKFNAPYGFVVPFETVGWSKASVDINLTELGTLSLRVPFVIPTGFVNDSIIHLRVIRNRVDDSFSYQEKVADGYMSTRTVIDEGFNMSGSWQATQYGFDWGLVGVPPGMNATRLSYNVIIGNDQVLTNNIIAAFTNTFSATRAIAAPYKPVNGEIVYNPRPVFTWTMPQEYNTFALEIKRGSSSGLTVFNSGTTPVTMVDEAGRFVYSPRIYSGSRMPSGETLNAGVYAWRVIAMNAKFSNTTSGWSDWQLFRISTNVSFTGYNTISAKVKYFGPATALLAQRTVVRAYANPDFSGEPVSEYTLEGNNLTLLTSQTYDVNAVLRVPNADYYIMAFVDKNLNGTKDAWESWGYARYADINKAKYANTPRRIQVSRWRETPAVVIMIEDSDSDQDTLPDAWEFDQNSGDADFLSLTGPVGGTSERPNVNPMLLLTVD